jgi:hypothetical protein
MAYDALLTSDVLNVFMRVIALFSTQQCRPIDNSGDGCEARFAGTRRWRHHEEAFAIRIDIVAMSP